MTNSKLFLPIFAIVASGLAGAATSGCHAQAQAKVAASEPVTPPAPPPPPQVTLRGAQMKGATQIDMPGDIEYQTGSAKIVMNAKSKKVLTQLAQILKDNPEITKLRIEGHTDNQGEKKGFDDNKLSKQRAQSVAEWLGKNGVDASRLTVVGWGSKHPLAANDSKDHMALNRRTEFHVQEFGGKAVASADQGSSEQVAGTTATGAANAGAKEAKSAPKAGTATTAKEAQKAGP
jgi:OOP family OmpA-OmpF porin